MAAATEAKNRRKAAVQKSGFRTFLMVAFGTLATAAVATFLYLGWANRLPPLPAEPGVLPNPNGYEECALAAAGVVSDPRVVHSLISRLTPSEVVEVQKVLVQDRPALGTLRKAMRLRYVDPGPGQRRPDTNRLVNYRRASSAFMAEAVLALRDGRAGRAADDALDAIDLGSRMTNGTILDWLTGYACAAMGEWPLGHSIEGLSADEAAAAGRRLDRILPQFVKLPRLVEASGRQSRYELREAMAGHVLVNAPCPDWLPSKAYWSVMRGEVALYPKPLLDARLDTYSRQVSNELEKPLAARSFPRPPTGWLAASFAVDPRQLITDWQRYTVMLRLERIELARQEYRKRHGREATTLSELHIAAPETLLDPYDEQPIRYRKHGSNYVLYSIGPDGKDDRGREVRYGDILRGTPGDLVSRVVILGHPPNPSKQR